MIVLMQKESFEFEFYKNSYNCTKIGVQDKVFGIAALHTCNFGCHGAVLSP